MVRGNDTRERSVGIGACMRQKGTNDDLSGGRLIRIVGGHENSTDVDICVGARATGIVGLHEEIQVQANDIHEHLAEVAVCVRRKGTYEYRCDIGEMTIDGHYEESPIVDCPQPTSGTNDGAVGSGYSGGCSHLFHRSKIH